MTPVILPDKHAETLTKPTCVVIHRHFKDAAMFVYLSPKVNGKRTSFRFQIFGSCNLIGQLKGRQKTNVYWWVSDLAVARSGFNQNESVNDYKIHRMQRVNNRGRSVNYCMCLPNILLRDFGLLV